MLILDHLSLLHQDEWDIPTLGEFGPDLFLGACGRQCVKTSTSNDCLLCLAHFQQGANIPSLCPCQVLGLGDSNSFSHILAGVLIQEVWGLAGVILTGSVISAGPRAEIRSHTPLCLTVMDRVASWPLRTRRTKLKPKTHIKKFITRILHLCLMILFFFQVWNWECCKYCWCRCHFGAALKWLGSELSSY